MGNVAESCVQCRDAPLSTNPGYFWVPTAKGLRFQQQCHAGGTALCGMGCAHREPTRNRNKHSSGFSRRKGKETPTLLWEVFVRGECRYLSPLWRGRSQSWRSGVNLGGESHKCGPTAAGAEPEPPGAGWQLVHEHPPNHSMPQNRAPPNHSTPRAAGQLPGSEQNSLLGHCRRQKPSYTPIPHSNLGRKHLAPRSPTGQPCVPGLSPAEVTAPR